METDLHRGLENDEFALYFQPKIDTRARTIRGVEALVRWQHPQRGFITPGEFIPVAEDSGLIVPLGSWVLDESCRQLMELTAHGCDPVSVAVNISPRQFRERSIVDQVRAALLRSGLPPHLLEIEITEQAAMENSACTLRVLERLKALGARISIDDFGTGYSSLSYLKRFPIDSLKIDTSFIRHVDSDTKDAAIVSGILALAKSLGLTVIAEGVETEAQYQFLLAKGCDQIQGYYFSRPVPFEALVRFIRNMPAPESDQRCMG